jgi:protein-tyrosine phosphatase
MITPNLFLGGQYSVKSVPIMKKLGITAIVNMRMGDITNETVLRDFTILHLPTPDYHAPSIEHLQEGVAFIKEVIEKGGKAYVHCHLGEGRGPAMAISYLISEGMTYDDAFKTVKKVRTFIHPNREQTDRLKEFEALVTAHTAAK